MRPDEAREAGNHAARIEGLEAATAAVAKRVGVLERIAWGIGGGVAAMAATVGVSSNAAKAWVKAIMETGG